MKKNNWDGVVDAKDLALLEMCMGAATDPNIVAMDLSYDSRVSLPDFAWFSYDYGYSGDPNESDNNDPNCARSDFDGDDRVDIADLAMLAEHWLTAVTDEQRLCSVCDLYSDPNAPAAIDASDMAAFMADWGVRSVASCSVSFKDTEDEVLDPNQLSGMVTLCVEECPLSTWVFVQIDGVPLGQTYARDTMLPALEIPTYEFSNGNHTLMLGGYTEDGGCWLKDIPVQFWNRLYYASIPEMYEPNELYVITGFFDEGTMHIWTDPNESTFSDSGHIRHSSTLSTDTAEATLYYENGEDSETQYFALLKSVDLSKEDPNSWRAVIIAPNKDINRAVEDKDLPNNRVISAIRETLEEANIPYKELLEKNAHWENIKKALTAPNLNYVYWFGHMNSHVGREVDKNTGEIIRPGVQRTNFSCWDKKGFWQNDKENSVFSWIKSDDTFGTVPALPSDWDTRGHSMRSLELWKTKTIKEFWAIGCKSAVKWETENNNDMALAVGVYSYKDIAGHYTHVYVGNTIDVTSGGAKNFLEGYPSGLSKIIKRHRTTNLGNALVTSDLITPELYALWGLDRDRDGYLDNTLQWWPASIELSRVIFQ